MVRSLLAAGKKTLIPGPATLALNKELSKKLSTAPAGYRLDTARNNKMVVTIRLSFISTL
jgi:hypothetical protein